MIMTNFLKNRESVRDYKKTKADLETIKKIEALVADVTKEAEEGGASFRFIENGEIIREGLREKGGYSGVMIESPHYIALKTEGTEEGTIYGAFYMEKLITELHKLGLATCWVTLIDVDEDTKAEVLGEKGSKVDFLLALGYEKPRNPFVTTAESHRKGLQDILFKGELGQEISIERLEERGLADLFYYIRFAPSTKNLQPWRFVLDGSKVTLYIEKANYSLTDAGIIMYYFRVLASTLGIRNEWKLSGFKDQGDFVEIATIEI